jgi:Putative rhamnosyl transferase
MDNFSHLLLTRFNVRVNYAQSRAGLDPEWLQHRFQLFDQFCYPSVRGQTNQNFKWLVYFDSETPGIYKQKIEQYAAWENFVPIYVDCEFNPEVNLRYVSNYLDNSTPYLITSRIDNDDSISKTFIQTIQDNFCEQELEFISFVYGYVWNQGKLYRFKYPSNPFLSLVERMPNSSSTSLKTVFCGHHSQMTSLGSLRSITDQVGWLQVVHGRNVSNRIRGIRQPSSRLQNQFTIHLDVNQHQEPILFYWIDKGLSLLKSPFDSVAQQLPQDLKLRLKALLT